MSRERRIDDELKFIDTCVDLDLLKASEAGLLRQAVVDDEAFASQESLKRGWLTASDVDIVHSLRNPEDVVPGYEIMGLVGRGGMGVVYRAKQLDLERIVALKTVLISNVSSPTAAARFEREAKTLARLQHPNIVQALNYGQHHGRYYFAMEFVNGRSCEQALRQGGSLRPDEVWAIVRQVASGLMHALRHNVIHRDIKPANLMLLPAPEGTTDQGGREVVKITDFGLAMFADADPDQLRLTTGDKIMGSPAYMSPEQFGGDPVDFRADIYALGATAWNLIFGVPPFQGKNLGSLLSQKTLPIQIERESMPVLLPQNQWDLLVQMLNPDEEERPDSYEQLIKRIDGFGINLSSGSGSINSSAEAIAISEEPTMDAISPLASKPSSNDTAAVNPDSPTPSDQTLSPTVEIESPRSGSRSPKLRRTYLVAGILVLILVGVGVVWAISRLGRQQRGPRLYTNVVDNVDLFDGETLSGWEVGGSMVGAWNTAFSPDEYKAIVCHTARGALTRRIENEPRPRISLFVWPQPGFSKIDIDFAFEPSATDDLRGCLRLLPQQVLLGKKRGDFEELRDLIPSTLTPRPYEGPQVVHIERQPTDWYIFLEEQFVGSIPISQIGEGSAIRIVVHTPDGPETTMPSAYFSDVRLDRLADTNG